MTKHYLRDYPYLLILHGKHDPSYFLIRGDEDFYKACETIFDWHKDWYQSDPAYCQFKIDEYRAEIEPIRATLKQLEDAGIKDTNLIKTLNNQISAALYAIRFWKADLELAKLVVKGTREAKAAVVICRSDYEYERLSKEAFSNE